mmetsp:Transcript_17867/g.41204  ORF Transcript_17867/g.41204 Transcript_17867/m.41204 type:complete len:592 (+) Transcript_17867:364-2139(+)
MVTEDIHDKNSNSNSNVVERKEAEALMKRLEAQFGDVDLDLEVLGILQNDEENETEEIHGSQELEEWEMVEKAATCDDGGDLVRRADSLAPQSTETNTASRDPASAHRCQPQEQTAVGCDPVADAEAAALLARLGAQFGDLDMSQLGLGVADGAGTNKIIGTYNGGMGNDNKHDCSDDDSSVEDPTPEELAAWQASQFSRGRERAKEKEEDEQRTRQSGDTTGTVDSIQQRRRILRETQKVESSSVLDLLGGDTSAFFGPSTTDALEELVSEATNGDPEILGIRSWKRLHASYEQGCGFWNLWKTLKGYDGPTLLILRCNPSASKTLDSDAREGPPGTACLGFYTTTPWEESSDLFGGDIADTENGDKAFLFSIDERGDANAKTKDHGNRKRKSRVRFFPVEPAPATSSPGYMYCLPPHERNEGFSGKNQSRAVVGLGVGGRPTQPRFHLTETLEDCTCLTYDSGRATRDGDLFSCFDDDDGNENGDRVSTATSNARVESAKTAGTRCRVDEGHLFARALYCFDVTELEVWGIGGTDWIDHALQERERARKQHISRFQKVDKQMMWDQGAFGISHNGGSSSDRNPTEVKTR